MRRPRLAGKAAERADREGRVCPGAGALEPGSAASGRRIPSGRDQQGFCEDQRAAAVQLDVRVGQLRRRRARGRGKAQSDFLWPRGRRACQPAPAPASGAISDSDAALRAMPGEPAASTGRSLACPARRRLASIPLKRRDRGRESGSARRSAVPGQACAAQWLKLTGTAKEFAKSEQATIGRVRSFAGGRPMIRCFASAAIPCVPDAVHFPRRQLARALGQYGPAAVGDRDHRLGGDHSPAGAIAQGGHHARLADRPDRSSLIAIQLVPLPPAIWTALPGRDFVANGYALLGQPLPWLPISLAPYQTIASALWLLPPLAIIAGMLRLGAFRSSWLAGGAGHRHLCGGPRRDLAGRERQSGLFALVFLQGHEFRPGDRLFRQQQSHGHPSGGGDPLPGGLVRIDAVRAKSAQVSASKSAILAGGLLVVLLGLGLNGSLAGWGLGVPVVAASALLGASDEAQLGALVAGGRGCCSAWPPWR